MTAWTDTVKATYKEGKAKNSLYSLKDAMLDAKKVYKSSAKTISNVANKVVPKIGKKTKTRRLRGRKGTAKRYGKK